MWSTIIIRNLHWINFDFVLKIAYLLVYDKFEQGATDIGSNILGWVAGSFYIF